MAARLANVIKLLRGDGLSPEGFATSMGHIIDFTGPQMTNERVEVTDGDTPSNAKAWLSGRQDPGPLSMNMNFDPDLPNHRSIITDAQASPPTTRNWRHQFSSQATDYFSGPAFWASFSAAGSSRDAALTAAVSLQPTGNWSVTAAA